MKALALLFVLMIATALAAIALIGHRPDLVPFIIVLATAGIIASFLIETRHNKRKP